MRYLITLMLNDALPEECQAECTVEAGIIIDVGNGHRGIVGRVEDVMIAVESTPLLTLDLDAKTLSELQDLEPSHDDFSHPVVGDPYYESG